MPQEHESFENKKSIALLKVVLELMKKAENISKEALHQSQLNVL